MEELLDREYFGNSLLQYLVMLGAIIFGLLLVKIFKKVILFRISKAVSKSQTTIDDFIVESIRLFVLPIVYFTIIYIGLKTVVWPIRMINILEVVYVVIISYYSIRLFSSIILKVLQSYIRRQEGGEEKVKQMGGVILILNAIIWMIGLVFMLGNLGYDITAIIAGMGIGGIAIALAAQNIIGDLFNYFVIFFDRPFEVGDFLVIGDENGTVDKIGIKTTRIKTLSGEQLIVANSDMTSSWIHNFKKMQRRRIVFTIGVTYETTIEQVKMIPGILKDIVQSETRVDFDRAHFKSFGDSSLDYEIVYIVNTADFNTYMDIQQEFNFQIYQKFGEMGISIAFPTRTLYLRNENDMKLKLDMGRIPQKQVSLQEVDHLKV